MAVRKLVFYLHDSAQRKTSESFGKIKEDLVLKIQKSFDNPSAMAELIFDRVKKTFKKKKIQKRTATDLMVIEMEHVMFMEEWSIYFTIYRF